MGGNRRVMAYTLPTTEQDWATAMEVFKLVKEHNPAAVFCVFRTQNTNTVVYSADDANAVTVEWHDYEKAADGSSRSGLNMIERNTAYGISTQDTPEGTKVILTSLKDREILVKDGVAFTTFDGVEGCQLLCVYVMLAWRLGMPKVQYIEIFGTGPDGETQVYEKKEPS